MRAMVPKPARTRSERVLTWPGSGSAEHLRVQLVGLAVRVQVGAGVERAEERRAALGRAREDLVDEAVLGAPEAPLVQAGNSR